MPPRPLTRPRAKRSAWRNLGSTSLMAGWTLSAVRMPCACAQSRNCCGRGEGAGIPLPAVRLHRRGMRRRGRLPLGVDDQRIHGHMLGVEAWHHGALVVGLVRAAAARVGDAEHPPRQQRRRAGEPGQLTEGQPAVVTVAEEVSVLVRPGVLGPGLGPRARAPERRLRVVEQVPGGAGRCPSDGGAPRRRRARRAPSACPAGVRPTPDAVVGGRHLVTVVWAEVPSLCGRARRSTTTDRPHCARRVCSSS
jgi:hypothetical protein